MPGCRIFKSFLLFWAASALWSGTEYPAGVNEPVVPTRLIIKMKRGAAPAAAVVATLQNARIRPLNLPDIYVVETPAPIAAGVSTALAAHPLVDFVEPDRIRTVGQSAPTDPNYVNSSGGEYGLFHIQAQQAWNLLAVPYLTGATPAAGRVKVAVLDTGADCTHPDFVNSGGSATDSAHGGQLLWSSSQALVATSIVSPACAWQDDHGHGTHVTGILAAATSNGVGVASLGYPLEVMEFKVLDSSGSGSDSTIANAIVAATNAGARVISMSLGGAGYSPTLQTAMTYAWQHNTVVVAAAGNSSTNSLFFPAGSNYALGVSASDINDNITSFSNFGNYVELAAPGNGILSTVPTYSVTLGCCNYGLLSGTSMATPFASALAGLTAMMSPGTTATAIMQRLEQTSASNIAGGAWDQHYGYGIINAYGAVAGVARSTSTGGIIGQITDSAGNAIASAQVGVAGQSFLTDSSGLFWIRHVTAGSYPISISASGFPTQNLTVTVASGADTPLSVMMGVGYGSFTGVVTDQGVPVAAAIVQALSAGAVIGAAVSDTNGQYTLWVSAGSGYTLQASQVGSTTSAVSPFSVASGGSSSVNLTLASLLGTIGGVVQDNLQNPVPGITVTVSSAAYTASAVTDTLGRYSIGGLPTNTTYTVNAIASGSTVASQSGVAVSADTTTTVNLQETPQAPPAPTFSPVGGVYAAAQTVRLASSGAGTAIHYTTDGSIPSATTGTLYSGPIPVTSSATINAIAYATNGTSSAVTSTRYTINSGAWYQTGGAWSGRKAITLNHTQVSGSAALTNFPVLISLTDANLQSAAKPDGADILFTAADGVTKLNHEIEQYNSATGRLVAWVNLPSLSPVGDTIVYLYFGNPSASSQQNPPAVWDANYAAVWHMPNGSTLSANDSTGNANRGVISGAAAGPGEIDGGASFNGASNIGAVNSTSLNISGAFTLECWVNPAVSNAYQTLMVKSSASGVRQYGVLLSGSGVGNVYIAAGGSGGNIPVSPNWTKNAWNHVVYTADGNKARVYINGQLAGSSSSFVSATAAAATAYLGRDQAANSNGLNGILDEARISNIARSADWIVAEYNNQSAPGSFYTVGGAETASATVSVTVTSAPSGLGLTVDGTACAAPCVFQWATGSAHTIAAANQAATPGTQYVFSSWSDSGAASHSIAPAASGTYTAAFTTQYFLTTAASPAAGGSISPASGWYNAGSVVAVSATANSGYSFSGFSGALTGSSSPQNLTMNGPASVTANFTIVSSVNWYAAGGVWSQRKAITIRHTQVSGSAGMTNFPVLISLTDANLQSAAKPDGSDILFTASDGVSKLNHELELYNGGTGQLVAWVNVPALSSTADTVIYIYFGNSSAASQQNAPAVWDTNYRAVWHLANGTTLSGNDSSANGNVGVISGAAARPGEIDGGASFNGASNIGAVNSTSLNISGAFTLECWVNSAISNAYQALIVKSSASGVRQYGLYLSGGGVGTIYVAAGGFGGNIPVSVNWTKNAWNHIVYTGDGTQARVYVNGQLAGSSSSFASVTAAAATTYLGRDQAANGNGLNGVLDEARISSVARSAEWILTEYNNQSAPGSFYTVGAAEAHP
jgi:hypothetical protein